MTGPKQVLTPGLTAEITRRVQARQAARLNPPRRIQLRRVKGWRKPGGCIVVSRPTEYGNPFTVVNGHRQGWLVYDDRPTSGDEGYIATFESRDDAFRFAVEQYRKHVVRYLDLERLRGHDLGCWCPPPRPCHADVLLAVANR